MIINIYIPIWLDLLSTAIVSLITNFENLHSNMVRFIMILTRITLGKALKIYIPIWLDLLL